MAPEFEPGSFASTKRYQHRTKVDESMAATQGARKKKIMALVPLVAAGSLSDADLVEGLTIDQALGYFGTVGWGLLNALFVENPIAEVDAIAVLEAAGTAAAGTVTFATAAAKDGVGYVNLGDRRVAFDILESDTPAQVNTSMINAIQADAYAPFAAVVDGVIPEECDLTYEHEGTLGNDVRVEVEMPDGIGTTAVVVQPSAGATDPTIDATYTDLFKMTDYDIVVIPWLRTNVDVEHLETVAAFMAGDDQNRGALFMGCFRDTYSNALAWAIARNRKDFSIIFQLSGSTLHWLTPPINRVGMEAGTVSAEADPSVPFLREARPNIKMGSDFVRPVSYDATIENALAHGLSIDDLNGTTGEAVIAALISTKTLLDGGVPTDRYESVHAFFVEKFARQGLVNAFETTFNTRAKRKMVPGKEGDVKGVILAFYDLYSQPPYQYFDQEAFLENKDGITVTIVGKRISAAIPNPIIHEYRGTDVTLYTF